MKEEQRKEIVELYKKAYRTKRLKRWFTYQDERYRGSLTICAIVENLNAEN